MILTINGQQAALKKGSSIEYVSENRIFTDADDYSMEIELPLADCPQNLDIFGMITRKDVDAGDIFFDAVLQDTNFINSASRMQSQVTWALLFWIRYKIHGKRFIEKTKQATIIIYFDVTFWGCTAS